MIGSSSGREPLPAPARRPGREWLFRVALVFLSVFFFLGFAELAARVLRSQQKGGKEGGEQALYTEYDPLLGWRKRPHADATYARREYTVDVHINSQGLRDPERPVTPPPGTFRVLALGDSFVEGYTVDLPMTVTQRLEARLNESGCASQVVNGGTAAYSTDQEYLFYLSKGVAYRPSLVLLFFYWNDIIYSDRQDYFGTAKPVFEMGDGEVKLHRYPVKEGPSADATQTAGDSPDDPDSAGGSALLEMLRDRLWVGAPAAHDFLAGFGLWSPIPKATPRLEMLVYDSRQLAPIEDAWEKVAAILKALRKDVEERGSTLALVYVPGRMEVQEASWRVTKQLYRLKDDAWSLSRVRDKLAALGVALDIPVVDLGPALRSADGPFRPTYFSFDGHWNARGHDVAAQTVFDWMRNTGKLPSPCGGPLPLEAGSTAAWDPGETPGR